MLLKGEFSELGTDLRAAASKATAFDVFPQLKASLHREPLA